jgi:hypothetical protein
MTDKPDRKVLGSVMRSPAYPYQASKIDPYFIGRGEVVKGYNE